MNERIKELAEQAGMNKMSRRSDGLYVVSEDVFKAFAELLIVDCAEFLFMNSGYDESNNARNPEPEDLLRYFGVEK